MVDWPGNDDSAMGFGISSPKADRHYFGGKVTPITRKRETHVRSKVPQLQPASKLGDLRYKLGPGETVLDLEIDEPVRLVEFELHKHAIRQEIPFPKPSDGRMNHSRSTRKLCVPLTCAWPGVSRPQRVQERNYLLSARSRRQLSANSCA